MDNSVSCLHVKLYSPHFSSMFGIMNYCHKNPTFCGIMYMDGFASTSLFILNYIMRTNYYIIQYISSKTTYLTLCLHHCLEIGLRFLSRYI